MSYASDVFNHLVSRTVYQNGRTTPATVDKYLYDGDNVLLQYTAVGTATPTLSKRFLNGLSVDEVLGQEDLTQAIGGAGRELWFVDDNQGTTRDLVDNSGNIAAHYTYTPFGQILSGATTQTSFLYAGGTVLAREWC